MGATFVQKSLGANSASTSASVSFTAGGTGNLICGTVFYADNVTLSTIKDNNGVSATLVDNVDDAGDNCECQTFYFPNVSGSPTSIIATFSGSVSRSQVAMQEWSGIATSTPLDGHHMVQSSGTTPSSGSITTTANGDLIYSSIFDVISNDTITAGSGYTIRNSQSGNGVVTDIADESQVQSSAGAINGTWTINNSTVAVVGIMAFKAAAVAAGPISLPCRRIIPVRSIRWI